MFGWCKLVWMRTKATQLVEHALARRLDLVGSDGPMFNSITRSVRDRGGNHFDAAALYMIQVAAEAPPRTAETSRMLLDLGEFISFHSGEMVFPDTIQLALDRLAETHLDDGP